MKIKELRNTLLGKTISFYDGFSGSHAYFKIGHVENVSNESIRVMEIKDKGSGVYVPKIIIGKLLSEGKYIEKNSIERCPFEVRWSLLNSPEK